MPIYAYRCDSCGARQDVLQKLSDAPLTVCPACGAPRLHKELSAPAFQLKGNGWYATDFRDKDKPKEPAADKAAVDGNAPAAAPAPANGSPGESAPASGQSPQPAGASGGAPSSPSPSSPSRSSSGGASSGVSGSASGTPTKTPVA